MSATAANRIGRPSRVRYHVLAMGVAPAAVTYLDRACISVTAPAITREPGDV